MTVKLFLRTHICPEGKFPILQKYLIRIRFFFSFYFPLGWKFLQMEPKSTNESPAHPLWSYKDVSNIPSYHISFFYKEHFYWLSRKWTKMFVNKLTIFFSSHCSTTFFISDLLYCRYPKFCIWQKFLYM